MTPEEQQEHIRAALDRLMRGRGHGTIKNAQQAIGRGPSYFTDQRRRRSPIDLRYLLKTLDFLGASPAEFFLETLDPSRDPIADLRLETDSLETEAPRLVTEVVQRAAGEEPTAPRHDADYLQELDSLRYVDARLAREQVIDAAQHVSRSLLPRLLGVYASALRLLEDHDGAQHALTTGLELATGNENRSAVADLWQRMAYVVADRGNYQRALVISERAEKIHGRVGDEIGVTKTLVDQGLWLCYLDRPQESIDLHLEALPCLLHDSRLRRCRTSVLQTLGVNCLKLRELVRAEAYAAQAGKEACELESWVYGGILWLQADIAKARRRYEEAEGFLREAVEVFSPLSAGQAALASIELVRSLVLQGRNGEAYQTSKAMATLLEPLRKKNNVAESALTQLIRCGIQRRDLTLGLLDDIAQKIRDSRTRRSAVSSLQSTNRSTL